MELQIGEASWRNEAWEEAKRGRQYAFFREDTKLNKAKSEAAGRPIYDPVILVEKIIPGDPSNRPVRPMREEDKTAFPQEWAAFQAKRENQISGTPLNAAPWLTRTQIAEYNALAIFTVEQLATLPESVSNRIMGFHTIKAKAENFLRAAQDSAYTERMAAENKQKDAELEALRAEIAELREMINGAQPSRAAGYSPNAAADAGEARRGPGRPPKQAAAG